MHHYQVSSFPLSVMFGLCVVFLLICVGCQLSLNRLIEAMDHGHHGHHGHHAAASSGSSLSLQLSAGAGAGAGQHSRSHSPPPRDSSSSLMEESKLMDGKMLAAVGAGTAPAVGGPASLRSAGGSLHGRGSGSAGRLPGQ